MNLLTTKVYIIVLMVFTLLSDFPNKHISPAETSHWHWETITIVKWMHFSVVYWKAWIISYWQENNCERKWMPACRHCMAINKIYIYKLSLGTHGEECNNTIQSCILKHHYPDHNIKWKKLSIIIANYTIAAPLFLNISKSFGLKVASILKCTPIKTFIGHVIFILSSYAKPDAQYLIIDYVYAIYSFYKVFICLEDYVTSPWRFWKHTE